MNNLYNDIVKDVDFFNLLPQSSLFFGKSYTGKLSTCLYTVKKLNCQSSFSDSCNCNSCRNFFQNFLILGSKKNNIKTLYNFFLQGKLDFSHTNFAVQIFLKRLEVFEKNKKDFDIIENIKNFLQTRKSKTFIQDIEHLEKIQKPNVDSFRKAISFLKEKKSSIKHKVLIIEHIENLSTNILNLLLKTLEEPPPSTFILLTCSNKNKLLKTVLSRVRVYYFKSLTKDMQKQIIKNEFNLEYKSFSDLFLNEKEKDILKKADIYYLILKNESEFVKKDFDIENIYINLFINKLMENIHVDFSNIHSVSKINDLFLLIKSETENCLTYNIQFSVCLENILLSFGKKDFF